MASPTCVWSSYPPAGIRRMADNSSPRRNGTSCRRRASIDGVGNQFAGIRGRDSLVTRTVKRIASPSRLFRGSADAGAGARHWPGLDGLRGTAILAVLLCHYSALFPATPTFPGVLVNGWAGVDLFFVISGFLITGILLDSKSSPNYFRNFYARRVLRIFPLYYAFLAAYLIVLAMVAGGSNRAWT